MKTIILCGGIGYRLKEETEFKPKPMVLIGGKPILWHIMKIYSYYGYNDFIIALGYRGEYIKEYFLNQTYFTSDFTLNTKSGKTVFVKENIKKDNFNILFAETGQDTLPGERILMLKKYIPKEDRDFMVTYGDGVSNINIKSLVTFHRKQKTIGTVSGVHPRTKYGLLLSGKNNIVTKFSEKPVLSERVNGGFMIFKKEFFNYLREKEMDYEGIKRLIEIKQLSIFPHDGFWHSMDTYPDVENLNNFWKKNPKWKIWQD